MNIRIRSFGFASVFVLAACGGKSGQMAEACQESSTMGAEMCQCMAETTESELSYEQFAQVVALSFGTPSAREAAQASREELSLNDENKAVAALLEALSECGIGIRTNNLP